MKYCILIFCLVLAVTCFGNSWHVGSGQSGASIREVLERAAAGDTVWVHGGYYAEGNLQINKPIHLIGLDYPVLDGQHEVEIITISAPRVTVRGFEIRNSGQTSTVDLAGIKVLSADSVFMDTIG